MKNNTKCIHVILPLMQRQCMRYTSVDAASICIILPLMQRTFPLLRWAPAAHSWPTFIHLTGVPHIFATPHLAESACLSPVPVSCACTASCPYLFCRHPLYTVRVQPGNLCHPVNKQSKRNSSMAFKHRCTHGFICFCFCVCV